MSVSGLKAELKFLESIFDPNHERFRIIDWKPDELSCQFNVTGEKLLIIHCNITVRRQTVRIYQLHHCRLEANVSPQQATPITVIFSTTSVEFLRAFITLQWRLHVKAVFVVVERTKRCISYQH